MNAYRLACGMRSRRLGRMTYLTLLRHGQAALRSIIITPLDAIVAPRLVPSFPKLPPPQQPGIQEFPVYLAQYCRRLTFSSLLHPFNVHKKLDTWYLVKRIDDQYYHRISSNLVSPLNSNYLSSQATITSPQGGACPPNPS
jgi:hypothetical protein